MRKREQLFRKMSILKMLETGLCHEAICEINGISRGALSSIIFRLRKEGLITKVKRREAKKDEKQKRRGSYS